MGITAKVDVKVDGTIKDLQSIKKDLMLYIPFKAKASVEEALPELRITLNSIMTRMYNSKEDTKSVKNTPDTINVPKLKRDIIKEVFGNDIDAHNQNNTNSKNDNVNIFVNRDKRIKAWQSVSDSSTYQTEENKFKNRLLNSLIVDYGTGRMYAPDPDTVKGIKVECSTDVGETLNSSKKFDAYKNSQNITRTLSPYQRAAIWTVKQADVDLIVKNSISIDNIVNEIMQGNYKSAQEILKQKNKTGVYTTAIEKIEGIRKGKTDSVDLESYYKLKKLIANLRIKRTDGQKKISISLVTSYDASVEEAAIDFFTEMKKYIYLWMVSNQDKWTRDIIKAIEIVIKKYNKKG